MEFKKRGGVVGDLVSGTGALIVLVVITLVVVSVLLGAGLIDDVSTATITDAGITVNDSATGTTVSWAGASGFTSVSITNITINASEASWTIAPIANLTINDSGIVVNASIIPDANLTAYQDINLTYLFTYDGDYQATANALGGNFTTGIDNVSGKIPTILLIAAVVLLFGVIVLLVKQSGAMGIGGGRGSL